MVKIEEDYSLIVDTSKYDEALLEMTAVSDDDYCNSFFSGQMQTIDLIVCGGESVYVLKSEFEYNSTFVTDPNFKLNEPASMI